MAKLEAMHPPAKKRLGFLQTPGFRLTSAFFEPLPEDELRWWEQRVANAVANQKLDLPGLVA